MMSKIIKAGGRPARLDPLTNTKAIPHLISTSRNLTDAEFEDQVNTVGYRVALATLRAKACAGDIKAIDCYLKRCDEWRDRRRSRAGESKRGNRGVDYSGEFMQRDRSIMHEE